MLPVAKAGKNEPGIEAVMTPVSSSPIFIKGVAGKATVPKKLSERSRVAKPGLTSRTKFTFVPKTLGFAKKAAKSALKVADRIGSGMEP